MKSGTSGENRVAGPVDRHESKSEYLSCLFGSERSFDEAQHESFLGVFF